MLLALTACGAGGRATPAALIPPATLTPVPLQGLFPTPTGDLFEFLRTPTSTPSPTIQLPTPTRQIVLPQTGADLSARPSPLDRLRSAGLVVAGIILVVFGLLRMRR
jgi:hypothetical protein